jgi:hypothetical protein
MANQVVIDGRTNLGISALLKTECKSQLDDAKGDGGEIRDSIRLKKTGPGYLLATAFMTSMVLLTELPAHADNFATGAYIIPMDTAYQDSGMLKAFGLVYNLLSHGVEVRWSILPGKSSQGTDFTASGHDLKTGAAVPSHGYRGGSFVIDVADTSAALPLIQAWWTAHPTPLVTVHVAGSDFTAPVSRYLVDAPKIAVHADGNQAIMFGYLNAASIPDSQGNTWGATSPNLLTPVQIAGPSTSSHHDGALFDSQGVPVYNALFTAHWSVASEVQSPETVAETRAFLGFPVLFFAECQAVESFENDANYGHFLTTQGLNVSSQPLSVDYYQADLPAAQIDGTFGTVGGSDPNFVFPAGGTWISGPNFFLTAHGITSQYVAMWGSAFGNQPGRVYYLGGHQYTTTTPISVNPQTQGVRLFLNSLFAAPGTATNDTPGSLILTGSAATPPAGSTLFNVTISYQNPGLTPVWNPGVTINLPAGLTFISAGQGGTYAGGQVHWTLPNVAAGASNQLTLIVMATTPDAYTLSATATYQVGITPFSAASPDIPLAYAYLTGTLVSPGTFQLGVHADNRTYQLQASGDLVQWQTVTNTTGGMQIPVPVVSTQQFFRLTGP